MKYRVLTEQHAAGMFVAEMPTLPGCPPQARTRAEALQNVREAIEVQLESLREHDEPVPLSIDEEIIDVAV